MSKGLYEEFHRNTRFVKKIRENTLAHSIVFPIIKKNINPRDHVLDLGCGSGVISLLTSKYCKSVKGVDISTSTINECNKSKDYLKIKNCDFVSADVETYNDNEKYDVILLLEVIEHIENDSRLVKKIMKMLKHKGLLIVSAPSKNAPLYKIGYLRQFDIQVGHLRRYTLNELKLLLSSEGFNIIQEYKEEGVIRNLFYTNKYLGKLIRFIRGPMVEIFSFIDRLTIHFFGESDLIIVCQK